MTVTTSRALLESGNSAGVEALRAVLGREAVSTRELDRIALAVDASHYLRAPDAVMRAKSADDVATAMLIASQLGWPLTLRSGGTSLSGQALSEGLAVDVRRHFRAVEVLDDGARVRVQPGMTIRQVNAALATHRTKLGPDPASEIACTVGGMIANNSSGMTCGTVANAYRTIESMVVVLPTAPSWIPLPPTPMRGCARQNPTWWRCWSGCVRSCVANIIRPTSAGAMRSRTPWATGSTPSSTSTPR